MSGNCVVSNLGNSWPVALHCYEISNCYIMWVVSIKNMGDVTKVKAFYAIVKIVPPCRYHLARETKSALCYQFRVLSPFSVKFHPPDWTRKHLSDIRVPSLVPKRGSLGTLLLRFVTCEFHHHMCTRKRGNMKRTI